MNGNLPADTHSVSWNAAAQTSGVYFLKLTSGSQTTHQKIMLIR
ncbi:T9SS C-terminal target domain-containing protein [candidate division KSB1 bacterium]|nr:MAG: T9SS C-terminal target domain-containing protein [candidate division KSB1 bacterium]